MTISVLDALTVHLKLETKILHIAQCCPFRNMPRNVARERKIRFCKNTLNQVWNWCTVRWAFLLWTCKVWWCNVWRSMCMYTYAIWAFEVNCTWSWKCIPIPHCTMTCPQADVVGNDGPLYHHRRWLGTGWVVACVLGGCVGMLDGSSSKLGVQQMMTLAS